MKTRQVFATVSCSIPETASRHRYKRGDCVTGAWTQRIRIVKRGRPVVIIQLPYMSWIRSASSFYQRKDSSRDPVTCGLLLSAQLPDLATEPTSKVLGTVYSVRMHHRRRRLAVRSDYALLCDSDNEARHPKSESEERRRCMVTSDETVCRSLRGKSWSCALHTRNSFMRVHKTASGAPGRRSLISAWPPKQTRPSFPPFLEGFQSEPDINRVTTPRGTKQSGLSRLWHHLHDMCLSDASRAPITSCKGLHPNRPLERFVECSIQERHRARSHPTYKLRTANTQ